MSRSNSLCSLVVTAVSTSVVLSALPGCAGLEAAPPTSRYDGSTEVDASHAMARDGGGSGGEASGARDAAVGYAGSSGFGGRSGADAGVECGPGRAVDRVDVLVVVGNTPAMRSRQSALAEGLLPLLAELSTRTIASQPLSLHLGWVTADLGVGGIPGLAGCDGAGDDGRLLQHCGDGFGAWSEPNCAPALGEQGCEIEQPMEAALKALWPAEDIDPETGMPRIPNRISFLGDGRGGSTLGHGDDPLHQAFFRNDPRAGRSLLAILVVSDGQECSSIDTAYLTPSQFLDPDDPLAMQPQSLRCFLNQGSLQPIPRYVDALHALRPGAEHLLVLGVIAGMPVKLVDDQALAGVDFGDKPQREAFYDALLGDPAMTQRVAADAEHLQPACRNDAGVEAPPASRLVGFASEFGANARVGSICEPDLSRPLRRFFAAIDGALVDAFDPGDPTRCPASH